MIGHGHLSRCALAAKGCAHRCSVTSPHSFRRCYGPEFIAKAVREWIAAVGAKTPFIEPGSPWENGYAESFHSRLRDEFLAVEEFESLRAARQLTASWRHDYNEVRPHSSLGQLTPVEFKQQLISTTNREPAIS